MKFISSPVSPHTKPISDLSFFWIPETEDMNKVASSMKINTFPSSPRPKLEPKFSFFWESEATKNEPQVTKFSAPVLIPIVATRA